MQTLNCAATIGLDFPRQHEWQLCPGRLEFNLGRSWADCGAIAGSRFIEHIEICS